MTDGGDFYKNFVAWISFLWGVERLFYSGKSYCVYVDGQISGRIKIEESTFLYKIEAVILQASLPLVLVKFSFVFVPLYFISCGGFIVDFIENTNPLCIHLLNENFSCHPKERKDS